MVRLVHGWSVSGSGHVYRGDSPSILLQLHFTEDLLIFVLSANRNSHTDN